MNTKQRARAIYDHLVEAHPDACCALNHENAFQLLIATMLSAQCTDVRVNIVTARLFPTLRSPADALEIGEERLADLIRDVGLFRNKARNIVATCAKLIACHGGEVPGERAFLEALPGVGRKTANVVLSNAFGVPALAVDTHVFRVAHRLGLTKAKTADDTEYDLCRLLPDSLWSRAHHVLIFHGRRICIARQPHCDICPVVDLCPTGKQNRRLHKQASSSDATV